MNSATGEGPGVITADGCAVEVYARLPPGPEADLIHTHSRPGASILDLGAGTGRTADPLVDLGHRVVAVDNSAAMLALVHGAETVLADIEGLQLRERFEVVLLASHLVNVPDRETRCAFLGAIAHHLTATGVAWIQWHRPDWFDGLTAGQVIRSEVADVAIDLVVHTNEAGLLHATVTYSADGERWTQRFTARRLTLDELSVDLRTAGLRALPSSANRTDSWIQAVLAGRNH